MERLKIVISESLREMSALHDKLVEEMNGLEDASILTQHNSDERLESISTELGELRFVMGRLLKFYQSIEVTSSAN